MSRIYDNWDRLVAAVIKREEIRELCLSHSRDTSIGSISSDLDPTTSSSTFDDDNLKSAQSEQHDDDNSKSGAQGSAVEVEDQRAEQSDDDNLKSVESGARESACEVEVLDGQWAEQYEPGVHITLVALGNGTREIKGAWFSKGKFNEQEAETWWRENAEKVYKKYNNARVVSPVRSQTTSGQGQEFPEKRVQKLKRSQLETACHNFCSIVLGSTSNCILYVGTLSDGVKIKVAHIPIASAKCWSNILETHFRKKIETLSKLNHKNFLNLLGYCSEKKPFTRMMVFEYAPRGNLFEYLHGKGAQRLDWATRLRIAMGIAYCLEHIHRLIPAFANRNLASSAVYLTEDYAAKLSDFFYWDEEARAEMEPNQQDNIYCFGTLLFEIITGHVPYSGSWLSDYHHGAKSLREMVDPTLKTYDNDQVEQIGGVIRSCTNPDPRRRPIMEEVCRWLEEITAIGPDRASPIFLQHLESQIDILTSKIMKFDPISHSRDTSISSISSDFDPFDDDDDLKSVNSRVQESVDQIGEWIEQYKPGVYITLVPLRDGTREIKRIRFSRKRFGEREAETWWRENRENVFKKYNVCSRQIRESSVSGRASGSASMVPTAQPDERPKLDLKDRLLENRAKVYAKN